MEIGMIFASDPRRIGLQQLSRERFCKLHFTDAMEPPKKDRVREPPFGIHFLEVVFGGLVSNKIIKHNEKILAHV